MSEQSEERQEIQPLLRRIGARNVELTEEPLSVKMIGDEFGVGGAIKLAGEQFLFFSRRHP
jgi:hypothetical protein